MKSVLHRVAISCYKGALQLSVESKMLQKAWRNKTGKVYLETEQSAKAELKDERDFTLLITFLPHYMIHMVALKRHRLYQQLLCQTHYPGYLRHNLLRGTLHLAPRPILRQRLLVVQLGV